MSVKTDICDATELDHVAIERAVAGDGVALHQLNVAEQLEVVRRLTQRGLSLEQIAARLATSTATVSRRRAQLRD
jgi:DNA-binding NarL/FixJ family response regulator